MMYADNPNIWVGQEYHKQEARLHLDKTCLKIKFLKVEVAP